MPDRVRQWFKGFSLAAVLAAGTWFLLPPADSARDDEGGEQEPAMRDQAVRFRIKFSPGAQYLPGMTPFGLGEPLEGVARVIKAFEARFPDTRIDVVNTPGVREYLVTQLSSGRAPESINVNVEDVWVDVQKGWYVALDPYLEAPNRFVREQGDPAKPGYDQWWDMFKYQAISRGKAAPDGRDYCISFDMVETGIFYNKDIFRKVGVDVPADWDAFMGMMARLEEAGYIPIIMVLEWYHDWCTDLFFDQLYYDLLPGIDLVQNPTREAYLQGYLDWDEICFMYRKGFFTQRDPRYVELWKLMKDFRRYANRNISGGGVGLGGTGVDPLREFVTQQGAMMWNASPLVYRLTGDRDLGFDWGVFYLPPFTKKTSPYASEVPMCVIGGAATQLEVTNSAFKDTGDPATSERLDRVIAFLQFLSLPEHYAQVVNEYPSFLPNIVGVDALPPLEPFARILERRYTTTKWTFTFDLKFSEIQRRMLELYLNDGISLDEFMAWQEDNLAAATANLLQRKPIDLAALEARWRALAPARAAMEGFTAP